MQAPAGFDPAQKFCAPIRRTVNDDDDFVLIGREVLRKQSRNRSFEQRPAIEGRNDYRDSHLLSVGQNDSWRTDGRTGR
jgi:hypothetical protein